MVSEELFAPKTRFRVIQNLTYTPSYKKYSGIPVKHVYCNTKNGFYVEKAQRHIKTECLFLSHANNK